MPDYSVGMFACEIKEVSMKSLRKKEIRKKECRMSKKRDL
jgi:hypothetical protein